MKKPIITTLVLTLVFATSLASTTSAQTTPTTTEPDKTALMAQIEALTKLIQDLQSQLAKARGEVREILQSNLTEGMEGEEIRQLQEFLATDPTVFAVRPTGFFGPITTAAISRLQRAHGLEVTGVLDQPTKDLIKELKEANPGRQVNSGFLTSQAAKERVRAKLEQKRMNRMNVPSNTETVEEEDEDEQEEDELEEEEQEEEEDEELEDLAESSVERSIKRLEAMERILEKKNYRSSISKIQVNKAKNNIREAVMLINQARKALKTDPIMAIELAEEADEAIEEGAENVDAEETLEEEVNESED
jgi:peptidoglycan hydrolase-like protein with peptidoglycan-binding domain